VTCSQLRQEIAGVKPVDGDTGGRLLRAAVRQHADNIDVYGVGREVVFRDDRFGPTAMDAWSPYAYVSRLARGGAAVQAWNGWMDAGTVDGALSRFAAARGPQMLVIGPWSHGADHDADPYGPPNAPLRPSKAEQLAAQTAFFDAYLKGDGRSAAKREIRYYTLGENAWHTTSVWPPRGVRMQRWFFGESGTLGPSRPPAASGADRYAVDFTATSGTSNRWHTQTGSDVVYPDRAGQDRKLLTYTSAPLARAVEITGRAVVSLQVSSTATDGAFIAYLEDVAPSGRVTYLTEGELRALHRKISTPTPPFHSFERADAQPLVPGQLAEVRFAMQPISVLIGKGHRIRIAVAGADRDSFARIPANGNPVITVERNAVHASAVDLPVR